MHRHLTTLLLAGGVALSACRSKPKQKAAELPVEVTAIGRVELRSSGGAAGLGGKMKAKPEAAQPKPGLLEPSATAPPAKPPSEPKLANPVPPPPVVSVLPKEKGVAVAKPAPGLPGAPGKAATEVSPGQPQPASPPSAAGQGSGTASAAKDSPPSKVPPATATPKPVSVEKPVATTVPAQALPTDTRVPKAGEGRGLELAVPAKSPATTPPPVEPLRTSVPPAISTTKPGSGSGPILGLIGSDPQRRPSEGRGLALPSGSSGLTNGLNPNSPLGLQLGSGTNGPTVTNEMLRPIGVEPLGKGGTSWRDQQLARQAAEQKAREEEQRKLKGALYRFLFKGGTN